MFDEQTLRKIADGDAHCTPCDEVRCHQAVKDFSVALEDLPNLATRTEQGSYSNFCAVYVYDPAQAVRGQDPEGSLHRSFPSLLIYFHHLAPIAALGMSSWGETLRSDGTSSSRHLGGLDLQDISSLDAVRPHSLQSRVDAALRRTAYAVQPPEYFMQFAPDWFGSSRRSEGAAPWNRLFHLFFQVVG
ncbi:hypothetical protein APR50_00025 [Variovorax paradoxus]|uniref:hypothetical protein n=1 Tax=Variovorax TaxID=34072 RepID=UPI0006E4DABC|nr:hypothetical protein [Variovorax sp.]KPV00115.1 hypothetical protein APR52_00480 [Variovorax paradoxus]KPV07293.1 hypothetical protein APR49_17720 [Variovorax paradoxus]KPV12403.1 hypothetical protein APR50_00025 [Variovorax paradoxus]KPV19105.1 hypothetical protein APR48_40370 [Variovorax paradoxus]KPV35609.1 hypothetical protein APR47_13160 [Variovorax paradoxus]